MIRLKRSTDQKQLEVACELATGTSSESEMPKTSAFIAASVEASPVIFRFIP